MELHQSVVQERKEAAAKRDREIQEKLDHLSNPLRYYSDKNVEFNEKGFIREHYSIYQKMLKQIEINGFIKYNMISDEKNELITKIMLLNYICVGSVYVPGDEHVTRLDIMTSMDSISQITMFLNNIKKRVENIEKDSIFLHIELDELKTITYCIDFRGCDDLTFLKIAYEELSNLNDIGVKKFKREWKIS
jgi:subtilase family serine protease